MGEVRDVRAEPLNHTEGGRPLSLGGSRARNYPRERATG
jgi:hypothetical protein